jgi:hypothetical protein
MWLAHLLSVTRRTPVMELRFRLTPVAIARPAEGSAEHSVTCSECRLQVRWKVFSVAATNRRRRNWLLLALAGLPLLIAGVIGSVMVFANPRFGQGNPTLTAVIILAALTAGFLCLLVGLAYRYYEHGVRVSGGSREMRRYFRPVHSVRPARRQKSKMVSQSAASGR